VLTAFPFAKAFEDSRAPMLPGFRFLFAAIMLSMSLLVFGLGAAALLRAAHESFASNSSWHATPELAFAQRTEPGPSAVLATLRLDAGPVEKAAEPVPSIATPAEPAPSIAEPAAPQQVAALKPADAPSAEIAKTDGVTTDGIKIDGMSAETPAPAVENPAAEAAAPPVAEKTASNDTTAVAADTPPDAASGQSEPVMAQSVATSAPQPNPVTAVAPSAAMMKIATLGGPPVDIAENKPVQEKAAKPDQAKTDENAVKKRAQARRAINRRRLAARARLAAQQQLLLANPFAQQPFPPAAPTAPVNNRIVQ
jgi:hypothetical protein